MSDEILEEGEQPAEEQPAAGAGDGLKLRDGDAPFYIGNIGEGANADWIKVVDGGRHQRADLAAHHTIMARYYEAQGDAAQAAHERELAAILTGETPPPEPPGLTVSDVYGDGEEDGWGKEEDGLPLTEDDW